MRRLAKGMVATALLAISCQAGAVKIGGRDWRQLTETLGLSWKDIAGVCSTATGVCSGSVNGISFDGWNWASNADIQSLFDILVDPAASNFSGPLSNYLGPLFDDPYIVVALGPLGFSATSSDLYRRVARAWSRTEIVGFPDWAYAPYLQDRNQSALGLVYDEAVLNSFFPKTFQLDDVGAWLYRSASVPEPGTLALLGLGLAGLGLSRRRKA